MLGPEIELELNIPEQTLSTLSFADHTPAAIKKWAKNLPKANIGETSRQLYHAIAELNQLAIAPAQRSQILETVREPIHYVCQELSKHFLNQSIVLPEKQQKVANLTQALQIHLATGYKIIIQDLLPDMAAEKIRKSFAFAAHRMISEYGQVILRANQLYKTAPKGVWQELHTVYQFAESVDLLRYTIHDENNQYQQETRIDQAYKRILLLSCARPNQMRQNDIQKAYDAFEIWAEHVEVGADYSSDAVFIINMQSDLPPRYRSLLHESLTDYYYGFDTAEIVDRLTNHLSALKSHKQDGIMYLDIPNGIPEFLLHHLNHALGILTKRTFKRIADDGSLEICVGLSASHYHASGQVEFHTQMLQQHTSKSSADGDENIFMTQSRRQMDAWSDAYDAGGGGLNQHTGHAGTPINFDRPVRKDSHKSYPVYSVPLVNTSPGGYCMQWQGDMPANIQAGEILAVRESRKQAWSIAVIRWIRHSRQKGTHIGIELLAPSARPCGVQLLHKTGAPSEFLRGMLLPELSSIGQPATLITPRLPFQTGHKVSLRCEETEQKCILQQCIAATGSFNQFELSEAVNLTAKTLKNKTTDGDGEDDFDSLWPTL